MKEKSKIPLFETVEEESDFWDSHSVTEFDAEEVTAEQVIAETKRHHARRRVSLSLDAELFTRLRALAAQRHLPTRTLVRELLWQGVQTQREVVGAGVNNAD